MLEQVADVVRKGLKGKDTTGLADHAGEAKGVETGLRPDVVDRHARAHEAFKEVLFGQFVGAKPAAVFRTARDPFKPLGRAAPYLHHRRRGQQPQRRAQSSSGKRVVIYRRPVQPK